jgi:hypothetical protein
VKTIDTLKAYIKFATKLFHLTCEKKVKCKTCHGKSEEKGEFGSPRSESLCFKGDTLIVLGPFYGIFRIDFRVHSFQGKITNLKKV